MVCVSNISLVNKIGYYVPICLLAAIFISVGSGLISTFSPGTQTGEWIGYQIILGVGRGLGLQMARQIFLTMYPTTS